MDDESVLVRQAIEDTQSGTIAYVKFLSANDSGETGGHQSGILVSARACKIAFGGEQPPVGHTVKRIVKVMWQGSVEIPAAVWTWYASKHELRLTRLRPKGARRTVLDPSMTGALFVLAQVGEGEYHAYVINTEVGIEEYLVSLGLGVQDANRVFSSGAIPGTIQTVEDAEETAIRAYVDSLDIGLSSGWPETDIISGEARAIQRVAHGSRRQPSPDSLVLAYTRVEYALFRALEAKAYGPAIQGGFGTVDDFVAVANTILNRRKSRAGKSLENHAGAIFTDRGLPFSPQASTEGRKKPDFIFPSKEAYHDGTYPIERIVILAAKTTCKDRWRQVLSEADRNKNGIKYLLTLQQGITAMQLAEMKSEKVQLIVPKPYIPYYPAASRSEIWTLERFIGFVQETI